MDTIHTIGRRKASVARVRFIKGKGNIKINNRTPKEYFKRDDPRNNKENYYIKDNDSNTIMPTLIIGSYMNVRKGLFGIAFNLIPLNASINIFFPSSTTNNPS